MACTSTAAPVGRRYRSEFSAEELKEVWDFYWQTEIPTTEIAYTYRISHPNMVCSIAGGAILEGLNCFVCEDPVPVRSRSHLKDIREKLSWVGHYWQSEVFKPVPEFRPDVCPKCANDLHDARMRKQIEALAADRRQEDRLRYMPYREYLSSPEWQARRKECLRRAKWRCQVCNGSGRLNVHHRTYERRGSERPDDLLVLCEGCHTIFHEEGKLAEQTGAKS